MNVLFAVYYYPVSLFGIVINTLLREKFQT